MKTLRPLSIVAALALLAASCSIYHPQAVDIPLIDHQGEWRVDASASVSTWVFVPDATTVGISASTGITPWLSAQVHANYGGNNNFYLQAAPGVYKRAGEKAVVEGFLGFGYGSAGYEGNKEGSSSYSYKGTYTLPFGQLNFGWRRLGPVELALGIKAGMLMPSFERLKFDADGNELDGQRLSYTTPNTLLEPQLQFRIGSENVKFALRLGYAWLSDLDNSNSEGGNGFTHDHLTLSSGLSFSF